MAAMNLECPKCAAPGSIPRNKVNTRLVCKKCRAVFHVTPSGRSVLGEPTDTPLPRHAEPSSRSRSRDDRGFNFSLPKMNSNTLSIGGGVAVALLLLYGIYVLFSRPDEIKPVGEIVANSIALDSLDFLRPNVLQGTEDDATKFFEDTRAALSPARGQSATKSLTAEVLVEQKTEGGSKAEILGIFRPTVGSAHLQQIAAASGDQPAEVKVMVTFWLARDVNGAWKLDGKRTLDSQPKH